jgi:hypothetical protein
MTNRSARFAFAMLAGAACAQVRLDLIVRDDFFAGMLGDAARLDKGMRYTEALLRQNPRDAQALVWHGSGLVTRASNLSTAGDSAQADRLWKQGIAEMDRARAIAPNDLAVKIGRSALLIGMSQAGWDPSDRRARTRLQTAIDDYEAVYRAQSQMLDRISEHGRCELLFGLAAGWSRLDQPAKTRAWLTRITQACGPAYAAEAAAYLDAPRPVSHDCIGCHVATNTK